MNYLTQKEANSITDHFFNQLANYCKKHGKKLTHPDLYEWVIRDTKGRLCGLLHTNDGYFDSSIYVNYESSINIYNNWFNLDSWHIFKHPYYKNEYNFNVKSLNNFIALCRDPHNGIQIYMDEYIGKSKNKK